MSASRQAAWRRRFSSAVSSSPEDAMKRSVQRISSSPCAGERGRSTLSASAAASNPSFAALEQRHLCERLAHDLFGLLERFLRKVLQRKAAERQRDAAAQLLPVNIDEFERAAAEIADNSVRPVEP